MPQAQITLYHCRGIWSADVEWPQGSRFVSGLTRWELMARVNALCRGLGRVPKVAGWAIHE